MSFNLFATYKKSYIVFTGAGLLSSMIHAGFAQAETLQTIARKYEQIQFDLAVSAPIGSMSRTGNSTNSPSRIPDTSIRVAQTKPVLQFMEKSKEREDLSTSKNLRNSVSHFSKVQPTDWTFQALRSLAQRHSCLADYANGNAYSNHALAWHEFADRLNACISKISQQIVYLSPADLIMIQQLQDQFRAELAFIQGQAHSSANAAKSQTNQFSTTTKLSGQAIITVGSGFIRKSLASPAGAEISNERHNNTVLYRTSLDLSTSFSGKGLLKIRLLTSSHQGIDDIVEPLKPIFKRVSAFPPGLAKLSHNGQLQLGRLYYAYEPFQDVTVSLGPAIAPKDYVDKNSYANLSSLDFSTRTLVNNNILFPIYGPSAGAAISWHPKVGPFSVRAIYVAADVGSADFNRQGTIKSLSPFIKLLYPNESGSRGLFGGPYQGIIELEYSPAKTFALRLQYSGGHILGGQFNVFGANFELGLSQKLAIFGRYGYGSYQDTIFGDINPSYWMAGVAFRDLFRPSAFAGIAASQPFIENAVGNATQTNFEAFYNFPLSDTIRVTPLVQVIFNPANQNRNDTVITGTLRTVFSF